jgi:toxin ParE1/3/4
MKRRIIRHDAAEADLLGHLRYMVRSSVPAARRFLAAVEEAFERLAAMPEMGSPCEFRNPTAADLRFWIMRPFPKHLIIYRPLTDGIEVVRIVHGAQHWQALFES